MGRSGPGADAPGCARVHGVGARHHVDQYLAARRRRFDAVRSLDELLGDDGVLLSPVNAAAGWLADGRMTVNDEPGMLPPDVFNTPYTNISGHPTLSLPAGITDLGIPFGLQVVGPRYRDGMLLELARRWEDAHPVAHGSRPATARGPTSCSEVVETRAACSSASSAARTMLRAIEPNTMPWKGATIHQYTCPHSPRGWKSARWSVGGGFFGRPSCSSQASPGSRISARSRSSSSGIRSSTRQKSRDSPTSKRSGCTATAAQSDSADHAVHQAADFPRERERVPATLSADALDDVPQRSRRTPSSPLALVGVQRPTGPVGVARQRVARRTERPRRSTIA